MISKEFIGHESAPFSTTVDAGRLQFFAKATGQRDPIYSDEDAAKAAGYRSIPVPPTFLFGLEVENPSAFALLHEMEVDLVKVLHGEQRFEYHNDICAGDTLMFRPRVVDIYEKKGGALEFIVHQTSVTNQDNLRVADLHRVTVIRN